MAKKSAESEGRAQGQGEEGQRRRRQGGADERGASAPARSCPARTTTRELKKLHVELVKLQQWVVHKGLKVCIVFEGRDGAGKGGTIKAITERVSPRVFRVIALPAPTEREKSQMYAQRYLPHLPAAGEVVIFDRSWYNRAGVERVMGFCTEEQAQGFLKMVPLFEKLMVKSGIILLKYWLEVSPEEQTRRLEARIDDGRKIWKLSPMDVKSYDSLGRLHEGARRDVRGDRHLVGAVVRRALGGQEARAPQRHQPPAHARSVQGAAAREGEAAEAQGARATAGRFGQDHSREVLTPASPGGRPRGAVAGREPRATCRRRRWANFSAMTRWSETLRNGLAVTIRPLRPDDRDRIAAAVRQLDRESIYTRLFSYRTELTEAGLDRIMRFDPASEAALLVTIGAGEDETVIGVRPLHRSGSDEGERTAEIAFMVEEDYHGLGIAGRLLRHLAEIARDKGIAAFEAEVLAENKSMLAVFARSGLPMQKTPRRRRRARDAFAARRARIAAVGAAMHAAAVPPMTKPMRTGAAGRVAHFGGSRGSWPPRD